MSKKLILNIAERLLSEPYFSEYKLRKKDFTLIKKTNDGFEMVELQCWDSYDLKRDTIALEVIPQYFRRFDILHKWFEKYSFKTLADQRDGYTVGFDGEMLNGIYSFFFLPDGSDFEQSFNLLKEEIIKNAQQVFNNYNTLTNVYNNIIVPVLENRKSLPDTGADWVFEYLKLGRIVDMENYDKLKKMIIQQVNFMNSRGEPNIAHYYPILDKIILDIEQS